VVLVHVPTLPLFSVFPAFVNLYVKVWCDIEVSEKSVFVQKSQLLDFFKKNFSSLSPQRKKQCGFFPSQKFIVQPLNKTADKKI